MGVKCQFGIILSLMCGLILGIGAGLKSFMPDCLFPSFCCLRGAVVAINETAVNNAGEFVRLNKNPKFQVVFHWGRARAV